MENATKMDGFNGIFAERLRDLMHKTATTQAQLAKELSVSRQAISTYMDGSVLPNIQNFKKICIFFNVSSDYLLGLSVSQSTNIEEREMADYLGLNFECVNKLKEYKNCDENFREVLFSIIEYHKPLKNLSATFSERFEVAYDIHETTMELKKFDNTIGKYSTEKGNLIEKLDNYKLKEKWLKFLSSEQFDVIFLNYYNRQLEKLLKEKRKKTNDKKD